MASYVVWHGKKREALARREDDLIRVLRRGAPRAEVIRAVEEVRASRIRFLRSERPRLDRCDGTHSDLLADLDARIRQCSTDSVEAIIDGYRSKIHPPDSSPGDADEPVHRA